LRNKGQGKGANQRKEIWEKDLDQHGAFKQVTGGDKVKQERPEWEASMAIQGEAILPVDVVGMELNL
jgi:hypothetical protein